jgi:hypothetical protein
MPLITPQDIISLSLRAAGILGVGQTALAEDNDDTFSALILAKFSATVLRSLWNSTSSLAS